ncbi:MAG TPA: RagB/SusD family nutrient uptake outer membrane protein [Puia sp.]|jgi:hypothetical protein
MNIGNGRLIRIVCLIGVLGTGSCKKWLDLKPQDGIVSTAFWKTKEEVAAEVIGCYSSLLAPPPSGNGSNDRSLTEYLFMWGELRGDMITLGPGASSEEVDVTNVNTLPTNSITRWTAAYRTINYCNTVIDYAPGVLKQDPTFTQASLNEYLAEVRSLRALMYFYLVRVFGDVPLKLTSTTADADLQQLPKTAQKDVLAQIVKDLSESEANAVTTFGDKVSDKGRITKYTISSIQADVYLWMDDYNDALTACNKVINSGKFGLIQGNGNWFTTLFYLGNSNEGIFEFQYAAPVNNPFYLMLESPSRRYLASGYVSTDVYNFDSNNPLNADIRGDGASLLFGDGTIWKYVGINSSTALLQGSYYTHWFVYRYADILLMKAEAEANLNNGADALSIINIIRTRANALPATALTPDPTDVNAVSDYILAERAREFAFEGKRWFDLLRFAKRNNYARLDILLDLVTRSVESDRQQSAIAKYKDFNSHYLPINAGEINSDPSLKQNPFYN